MLATVHEITEKIIAERRAVALRDLGARMAEAKTGVEAHGTISVEPTAGGGATFIVDFPNDTGNERRTINQDNASIDQYAEGFQSARLESIRPADNGDIFRLLRPSV